MVAKHSLIVDDSKSARIVLKRMLEELGLDVDTVESADDAISYLKHHRPDVIFMDHMMPGMDGFEAVKLIKNNTKTAVIPIMMYTSRGGEVYLSQARALGAVGIIPKTISHVGLKESLFKLGLIEDRRKPEVKTDKPAAVTQQRRASDRISANDLYEKKSEYANHLNDLGRLLDDQTIELHKSMWLGVESVSNEIFNRLNSELEERFEKLQPPVVENKHPWPLYVIGALLVFSVIINLFLLSDINQLEERLHATEAAVAEEGQETVASLTVSEAVQSDPDLTEDESYESESVAADIENNSAERQRKSLAFINWAKNRTINYPYDELALNDNRLREIDELLGKAVEAAYAGSIILQTHVGRFCLIRDLDGEYKLADDNLPVTSCDYIGNHVQPIDLPSTHQSLSFANYLSELDTKDIVVDVVSEARTLELSRYPVHNSKTTAKEWNLAARQNNRITVRLLPASAGTQAESPSLY